MFPFKKYPSVLAFPISRAFYKAKLKQKIKDKAKLKEKIKDKARGGSETEAKVKDFFKSCVFGHQNLL